MLTSKGGTETVGQTNRSNFSKNAVTLWNRAPRAAWALSTSRRSNAIPFSMFQITSGLSSSRCDARSGLMFAANWAARRVWKVSLASCRSIESSSTAAMPSKCLTAAAQMSLTSFATGAMPKSDVYAMRLGGIGLSTDST